MIAALLSHPVQCGLKPGGLELFGQAEVRPCGAWVETCYTPLPSSTPGRTPCGCGLKPLGHRRYRLPPRRTRAVRGLKPVGPNGEWEDVVSHPVRVRGWNWVPLVLGSGSVAPCGCVG